MTCQDCIHYTDEIINDKYHLCDAYKTIGGTDRQDAWAVSPTDRGCKLFEPIPVMVYPQVDGITPTVVADEGVCNRGSHIINEQYTESMLRVR